MPMSKKMKEPGLYHISAINWLFLVISVLSVAFSFRFVAFIVTGVFFLVLTLKFTGTKRQLTGTLALVAFIAISIQPFDISFINVPGSPRIVPYVKGLPTAETMIRAMKGDVVLGGCIVTNNHPKWLFVW